MILTPPLDSNNTFMDQVAAGQDEVIAKAIKSLQIDMRNPPEKWIEPVRDIPITAINELLYINKLGPHQNQNLDK